MGVATKYCPLHTPVNDIIFGGVVHGRERYGEMTEAQKKWNSGYNRQNQRRLRARPPGLAGRPAPVPGREARRGPEWVTVGRLAARR